MSSKPVDFSARLKELEDITAWFESDNVDLDQGLAKFERGMELASELKEQLASVENRVEKIKQKFTSKTTDKLADTTGEPEPEDKPLDLFDETAE